MKPINKIYAITAPASNLEPIMLNADCVQMQVNIVATLAGTATYSLQGNVGMINTDLNKWGNTAGLGQVIVDPNGWFEILPSQTATKQIGTADLLKYLPVVFIRPVVTAGTAATLTLNVLQQAVR